MLAGPYRWSHDHHQRADHDTFAVTRKTLATTVRYVKPVGAVFFRPFRALGFCGRSPQGVARRLALPWAILFRAFSPFQPTNRTLAEEIALAGKFFVPKEQRVTDSGQEQLQLHATVEELVRHDLALRENADDGRYLVFPSQFNRDYEDAPEPKGKAVAITFDGPIQSLYSTLVVRLGHTGLFTTNQEDQTAKHAKQAKKQLSQ